MFKLESGNCNKNDVQTFFFQLKLKKKCIKILGITVTCFRFLNEAKSLGVLKRRMWLCDAYLIRVIPKLMQKTT